MGYKFHVENKDKLESCERKELFDWEEALISLGIYNYGMVICKKERVLKNFESSVDRLIPSGL